MKWGAHPLPFTLCSLLFLLLVGSSFLRGQVSDVADVPASSDKPVEITADGNTQFENGIALAQDNVQIHYKGVSIYCDKAEYNPDTRDVLLLGNVRIYQDKGVFNGQRALYNLETKHLRALEFQGDVLPMKFHALSMKSITTKEFSVRDGVMTTSDSSMPTWSVHARGLRIYDKDRVIFLNSTLYAGKMPLLWLPYLYASLKETGFQIMPGYDSTWGGYLLTSYSAALTKDDALIARVHADYRSMRGFATGVDLMDHFGKNNRNSGEFILYYAWDHTPNANNAPGEQSIATPTSGDYVGRYRIGFNQKFYLNDDVYATADMTKLSDSTFMQTYYPSENTVNPQPDNNIALTKMDENYTLSMVTRWQMNSFQETTERLPELAFDFKQEPFFGLPVFYDGTTALGQLQRNFAANTTNSPNYVSPQNYNATRFDTFHQLSLPKTLFGWLSVVPKVGLRITAYNHGGDYADTNGAITTFPSYATSNGGSQANQFNWTGTTVRPIVNGGVETSFKVTRSFETIQSRLLALDGLRHIFQPYANLSGVYAGGPNVNQVMQFDRYMPNNPNNTTISGYQPSSTQLQPLNFPQFNAIDTIDTWAIMRVGVRNKLQTRRDGENYDWFYLDTFTDLNAINPYFNGPVSNLNNRFTFLPVSWFSFHIDSQVPMTNLGYSEVNTQFDFMPTRWLQFGFGSAYINNYNGMNGNQPSISMNWKLNDHWAFSATQIYNINDSTMSAASATTASTSGTSLLYQRYVITRDLSCWLVSFGAEVRNNQSTSTQSGLVQTGAVFTMALKDAPQITLPLSFTPPTPAGRTSAAAANPLMPGLMPSQ